MVKRTISLLTAMAIGVSGRFYKIRSPNSDLRLQREPSVGNTYKIENYTTQPPIALKHIFLNTYPYVPVVDSKVAKKVGEGSRMNKVLIKPRDVTSTGFENGLGSESNFVYLIEKGQCQAARIKGLKVTTEITPNLKGRTIYSQVQDSKAWFARLWSARQGKYAIKPLGTADDVARLGALGDAPRHIYKLPTPNWFFENWRAQFSYRPLRTSSKIVSAEGIVPRKYIVAAEPHCIVKISSKHKYGLNDRLELVVEILPVWLLSNKFLSAISSFLIENFFVLHQVELSYIRYRFLRSRVLMLINKILHNFTFFKSVVVATTVLYVRVSLNLRKNLCNLIFSFNLIYIHLLVEQITTKGFRSILERDFLGNSLLFIQFY